MKKLFYIFILFSFVCHSQITNLGVWNTKGNTFVSNVNFVGTKNNRSLVLKSNIGSNTSFTKYDSLGNFSWKINPGFTGYDNKIRFQNWAGSGTDYPAIYLEVIPTKFNYAIYSDSLITTFNGPQTIGIVNQPYTLFNATASNPAVNGNRYFNFGSINTATATLSGAKTDILIQGCTWGFNGTPTITPTKILIGADTYSATNVTVSSLAITLDVPRPIASTNIVITNSVGLRVNGNANFDGKSNFGSSGVTPSGIIQMPAGSATNPALKFTSQTAVSLPNNGEIYFNGSTFFIQGNMSNSLNNITVGTSSVGSTFTASGATKMNGIANTGSITTSTTFSCGTTFTAGGAATMNGIANTGSITTSTTFSCGGTATIGGILSLTNYTPTAVADGIVFGSATLDFPSATAITVSDLTIAVVGARLNDKVSVGVPNGSVTATAKFYGWVSATDVVKIRFTPKGTEDPASGVFKITVCKN